MTTRDELSEIEKKKGDHTELMLVRPRRKLYRVTLAARQPNVPLNRDHVPRKGVGK